MRILGIGVCTSFTDTVKSNGVQKCCNFAALFLCFVVSYIAQTSVRTV